METEFNILYYIDTYKKFGRRILTVVLISMVITGSFSFLKPPVYVSTVMLLTKDANKFETSSLSRFLGFGDLSFGASSNEIITAVLKSRRMEKDIEKRYLTDEKSRKMHKIEMFGTAAGLEVEIQGSDPSLTQKIADFAIKNLDTINGELNITPNKPMVKILDHAAYGKRKSRNTVKKMLAAGILSFLAMSVYIFLSDYLRRLKLAESYTKKKD